jgi:hypothetical protein
MRHFLAALAVAALAVGMPELALTAALVAPAGLAQRRLASGSTAGARAVAIAVVAAPTQVEDRATRAPDEAE